MVRFKGNSKRQGDYYTSTSLGHLEVNASGITTPLVLEQLRSHLSRTNCYLSFICPGEIQIHSAMSAEVSSKQLLSGLHAVLEQHQFVILDARWVR